nr:ankyrin repeat-containing protein itn1 [Quercus suber]
MTMTPTPSSTQNPLIETSPSPSPSATATAPALVLSNSGKQIDQAEKKKYVKQVTGWHNDTELHLAAQRGDLVTVRQILEDIVSQMMGDLSGEELKAEVAQVRAAVVNEVNELGETALFMVVDKGYLDILKELLTYSSTETLRRKTMLWG